MLEFHKVALITRENISSWKSCEHITSNLLATYAQLFKSRTCKTFSVKSSFNRYEAGKLVRQLTDWGADLIIWVDHSPNPLHFIEELCFEYHDVEICNRPKLLIHIFGDFVLDCRKWEASFEKLKMWPVHFFTASSKQKKLISSFFSATSKNVSSIPFPVNGLVFNNQNMIKNRMEIRKKMNIELSEKVLIYTGRISYQKNVDTLIKLFEAIKILTGEKVKLVIAGPWDDILVPYFGMHGACGSYYNYYLRTVESIQSPDVIFAGNLNSEDLLKYYHASDLFVSLSTYNDEDYGMSPSEALCSGLPCILSDWAGYSTFKEYVKSVELISVNRQTSRPNVLTSDATKILKEAVSKEKMTDEDRSKISSEALTHLSIDGLALKIENIINDIEFGEIKELTPVFKDLCQHFKINPRSPFSNQLYKEVYGVY